MGHTLSLEYQAVWKILVVGLVLGAGLPTVFALGVRSLALGTGGEAEVHAAGSVAPAAQPIGLVLAFICFAIVVLAVLLALTYIVATGFGDVLSFNHVFPEITTKK